MDIINYEETEHKPFRFSDEGTVWYGDINDRPEIEQQLQELQSQFYKTEDKVQKQNIWSDMFVLTQKYSKSLVLKKNKGNKYVDPDEIEDRATQTALAFMSQYIYRPGFHCGASFAGMINPKVLETLYKYNKEDHNFSLNSLLGDTNLELEDIQEKANFKPLYENAIGEPGAFIYQTDLKEVIGDLFREVDSEIKSEAKRFKIRMFLQILLRKSKNKHSKPTFQKYICDKKDLDLINLFEMELRERLLNTD
jgi:hypothetical protein